MAFSKLKEKRQEWGWDSFNEPHVCWNYLKLAARCWEPTILENKEISCESIEACHRSGNLLGLHGFWKELQNIRNKTPDMTPSFFTIERFSNYIEVVCRKVLAADEGIDTSIHALQLTIFGDSLLLLVKTDLGRVTTPYLLHTYQIESRPFQFMHSLIKHPERDWRPSDVKMCSGSPSQLLDRANFTNILRKIFIKEGSRAESIKIPSPCVEFQNIDDSSKIAIQEQIDRLDVYSPPDIILPVEWTAV